MKIRIAVDIPEDDCYKCKFLNPSRNIGYCNLFDIFLNFYKVDVIVPCASCEDMKKRGYYKNED